MRYLQTYRIFESGYQDIRSHNSHLEDKFRMYDEIIKDINKLYDNVSIRHRGNMFYDIYYTMGTPGKNESTIHIGGYDITKDLYYLFRCRSIDKYSSQGCDTQNVISWKDELNEDSFDKFVNKWYDIYDSF